MTGKVSNNFQCSRCRDYLDVSKRVRGKTYCVYCAEYDIGECYSKPKVDKAKKKFKKQGVSDGSWMTGGVQWLYF